MGTSQSKQEMTRKMEKYLHDIAIERQHKILMFGPTGSGKTTFGIQLNQELGLSPPQVVRRYLLRKISDLLSTIQDETNFPALEGHKQNVGELRNSDLEDGFDHVVVQRIRDVWSDTDVFNAFKCRRSGNDLDSLEYLMGRLDSIAHPNYQPNREDSVRALSR